MADLIDRAKAIKAIEDMQDCYNGFSGTYDKAQIIGVLEEVPTAKLPDTNVGDIISRQAAIDVLGKIFPADPMRNDYTKGITCGAALATEYIKQLPTAERKGHWIELKCGSASLWKCSECGELFLEDFYYCPNCGARMESKE